MSELVWYFPENTEELKNLVQKQGVLPHGGGTGLLRGDVRRYKGLISLEKMGVSTIDEDENFVIIGATATYSDIINFFKKHNENAVLYKSLVNAATTPLRNRITIGGSIGYFPPWSDIMGPLLALSSEVYLVGEKEGWFKISDYVGKRDIKKNSIILKVRYRKDRDSSLSYHFRALRTKVDHPAFTITMLLGTDKNLVKSADFYVVGTKDKFRKLSRVESQIVGKESNKINVDTISLDEVEFYGKTQFSPEYQKTLFEVEFKRGLKILLEQIK